MEDFGGLEYSNVGMGLLKAGLGVVILGFVEVIVFVLGLVIFGDVVGPEYGVGPVEVIAVDLISDFARKLKEITAGPDGAHTYGGTKAMMRWWELNWCRTKSLRSKSGDIAPGNEPGLTMSVS